MNLLTPPPVEKLDPEYAGELRRNAVRGAYKALRPRPPKWVPAVAAACGVAVVTTAVVLLSGTGDHSAPEPAGSPRSSIARPPQVPLPSPDNSGSQSIDLGPATAAEASADARKCLAQQTNRAGGAVLDPPAVVDPARPGAARWIKAYGVPGKTRQLVQSVWSTDGWLYECLDDQILRIGGTPGEGASSGVTGTWAMDGIREGDEPAVRAEYSFVTGPEVVRVELRIRSADRATPWYVATVNDRAGYVAAVLPGATNRVGLVDADVRAFDKSGKQVFFDQVYD
jgi:hypothetical protein